MLDTLTERDIYTVKRLNLEARVLLESQFRSIWLEGELSNFRRPSDHWYFTLKEEGAEVRAAMFRMSNARVKFTPKDGMHVMVRGKVSLFEARGDYQFIVEGMEEAGDGKLKRAFEALKQKLQAEGLFSQSLKKSLPPLPKCIGIITSPTGAAVRDVLCVLKRRFAAIPVIIYPSQVQGTRASDDLVRALTLANQRKECDVLLLTRGGGSLEDLWPFNEERVARAIIASELPVISAVGHEIDVTIADFVSDLRAATPSAAAELIVPDHRTLINNVSVLWNRMMSALITLLKHAKLHFMHIEKRLQHPGQRLLQQFQNLDHARSKLLVVMMQYFSRLEHQETKLKSRLQEVNPLARIQKNALITRNINQRLHQAIRHDLTTSRHRLNALAGQLHALSPLATLGRGYALVTDSEGKLIMSKDSVSPHMKIHTKLVDGELHCTVDAIL